MDYRFKTSTPDETRTMGRYVGECLEIRTVIALKGDLGSGKTVFVQGLAAGMGVAEGVYVTSPTFTLINEYQGRRLRLFHIDLYRIEGAADLETLGLEEIFDSEGVIAVEWAERLSGDFLSDCVTVQLDITGDESRDIRIISCGRGMKNLIGRLESFRKV